LIDYSNLGNKLGYIYEKKFNLKYHLGLAFSDYENTYLKELDWMFGRLVKQRNEENKAKGK